MGPITYSATLWPKGIPADAATFVYIDPNDATDATNNNPGTITGCSCGWLQGWQAYETTGTDYFANLQVFGGGSVVNATITDPIPPGVTYTSASPFPTSGAPNGPLVWNFPGPVTDQCPRVGGGLCLVRAQWLTNSRQAPIISRSPLPIPLLFPSPVPAAPPIPPLKPPHLQPRAPSPKRLRLHSHLRLLLCFVIPTNGEALGTNNDQFQHLVGIAVDSVNNWVYVTDWTNNRLQKFDLLGIGWPPGVGLPQGRERDNMINRTMSRWTPTEMFMWLIKLITGWSY